MLTPLVDWLQSKDCWLIEASSPRAIRLSGTPIQTNSKTAHIRSKNANRSNATWSQRWRLVGWRIVTIPFHVFPASLFPVCIIIETVKVDILTNSQYWLYSSQLYTKLVLIYVCLSVCVPVCLSVSVRLSLSVCLASIRCTRNSTKDCVFGDNCRRRRPSSDIFCRLVEAPSADRPTDPLTSWLIWDKISYNDS